MSQPTSDERASIQIVSVSDDGLRGRGHADTVLDVLFDGRLIWSLRFRRDSVAVGEERLAPWPEALRPFLDGTAQVRIQEHSSARAVFDRQVRLGSGAGRITVVDEDGRPLSVTAKRHLAAMLSQRGTGVVDTVLDAATDVLTIMRTAGVDGFLAYGSLLGAIRTGHVIAHDYDVDLSYLSAREHPVDAIGESYRLERAIRDRGYAIRRYSAMAFQVRLDSAEANHPWLDVFGSLIVGDTLYVLWDVGAPLRRDQVLPLGSCRLEGREFPAPRDTDAWLAATYGPTWRVPDPAFTFSTPPSVTRRLSGWFGRLNRGRREWDELHSESKAGTEPSAFARWVTAASPDADVIADLGCGLGTDALWYASLPYADRERRVLGLDFSAMALERAQERADRTGSSVSFRDLNLADLRSVLLTGAMLARLPGRRILTARLLADGLIKAERDNLWLLARMALRKGGLMYLENAMPRDPRHRDFAAANRLRRLTVPVLRAELEAAGAMIHERQVVESPPDCQVPDTIRMVLSWPR